MFSETAEDQTNQHGGGGEVKLFCQITDYTENDGDKTVINRVAAGIGADKAEGQHDRQQHRIGNLTDLTKCTDSKLAHIEHQNVDDQEANNHGIGHIGMLCEELRAGIETLNHQGTHQHGGNHVTGDTECQHGNQCCAGYAIVGAFCCGNGFRASMPVLLGMLGAAF